MIKAAFRSQNNLSKSITFEKTTLRKANNSIKFYQKVF